MQVHLVTTPQRVFDYQTAEGASVETPAPNAPNSADVDVVKSWLLGLTPHRVCMTDGLIGDNGCTLEIQVTQQEFDDRFDCSLIVLTEALAKDEQIAIPANVKTALENIISVAYTP